jgi:hypothetical protein
MQSTIYQFKQMAHWEDTIDCLDTVMPICLPLIIIHSITSSKLSSKDLAKHLNRQISENSMFLQINWRHAPWAPRRRHCRANFPEPILYYLVTHAPLDVFPGEHFSVFFSRKKYANDLVFENQVTLSMYDCHFSSDFFKITECKCLF